MKLQCAFLIVPVRRYWAPLLGLCATAGVLAAAETNAPPATTTAPPATTNALPGATNAPLADTNAGPAVTNAVPAAASAPAPETNAPAAATKAPSVVTAPPPMTPEQMFEGGTNTYKNWVDFTIGQAFVSGNRGQFQQQHQIPAGTFGGISDAHFETNLDKKTTLTLDGHAMGESHDYEFALGVQREKTGYFRMSYDQARTWSDADGGYFPGTGRYYGASNNAAALDRGKFSLEAGWTPEKGPSITFKYTHSFRDGDEGSTEWGFSHPMGSASPVAQGLAPALEVIHESSDSVQLDISNHIKSTDLGGGLRFETGTLNDALQVAQYPGEKVQKDLTASQGTGYDLLNAHAYTATWLKTNIMLSTGFSYSDVDNNFTGSQIFGNDFYTPYAPNRTNTLGYYGMNGASRLHEYVVDLNLFYKPSSHFIIAPSIRVDREDWNASSAGIETDSTLASAPYISDSTRGVTDVRERLDLTYNGLTNWVLYARGDFTQGDGSLDQSGGMYAVPGIGNTNASTETLDRRNFQKYSAGVRWYPAAGVTLDVGGYYQNDKYHYDNTLPVAPFGLVTPYQEYLILQDFKTYDANFRLTLRPWKNLTAISRYEFQLSTIGTAPDAAAGITDTEVSRMTTHVIAEDVSWIPWNRLSLQAGLNYVLSETRTPGSDVVQGILEAQNNYWTFHLSSVLALDNKTDLSLSYLYYLSGDYENNSPGGVPFGAGSEEHAVTATLTRRLSKNLRLAVKYGYYRYDDEAYGSNRDFGANVITASLRYRF